MLMSNNPPRRVIYKPSWVANSFLVRAQNDGVNDVDPLKIQKLVYNLHGWNLAVTGSPVMGERFEAWPHGPVCSAIYHQFKDFKFRTISRYAQDIDPSTGQTSATYVNPSDTAFYDIFDRVWGATKDTQASNYLILLMPSEPLGLMLGKMDCSIFQTT
jgi:uncharacterized phage-associated protein